jgi:hypothetical protein
MTAELMSTGRARRRLQLRLPAELTANLEHCARQSGISVCALVRLVLEDAVTSKPNTASDILGARGAPDDQVPALAALVAAEHALRLLETFLPSGAERSAAVRATALVGAEARLEELRRHLEAVE